MSAANQRPLRLVPFEAPRSDRAPRGGGWRFPLVVGLAIVAMLIAIAANASAQRRGLAALPEDERGALLATSVSELRRFCGDARPGVLKDHCRELASFAARFDECRGECEALVRRQLTPAPTR